MIVNLIKKYLRQHLTQQGKKIVSHCENLGREPRLDLFENHFTNDFVRLSLLDLAIDEIETKEIGGSIAELGVYKGQFARVLNRCFHDRKLYLFDTFEGFASDEEQFDTDNFGMDYQRDFTDTSLESVMASMPNPDMCVARKGLFPATSEGLENEQFAFVSIDTDLYKPIKSGLEFFYDRLATGGFIFVHDYTNTSFPGARQAVNEFSAEAGVSFVPVCDRFGSAIFRK